MTNSKPLTGDSIFFFAIHQIIPTSMQRPPNKPPNTCQKNAHWAARILELDGFTAKKRSGGRGRGGGGAQTCAVESAMDFWKPGDGDSRLLCNLDISPASLGHTFPRYIRSLLGTEGRISLRS